MKEKVVLIVDDEPRSRKGIKKTIERSMPDRCEVLTAANAEEALGYIQGQRVHVLITDIRMPEISGLELLKQLKEEAKDPVVIVISAYSEFDYAKEALELGVVNYLLKPIAKEKLLEALEKAFVLHEQKETTDMYSRIVDDVLVEMKQLNQYNPAVRQALHYVDENFDKDVSLKETAAVVHLNSSYLSALFKEELGVTFSEYVTRKRVQEAKKLLLTTDLTIADIAEEVGYHTSKYFIKLFKQLEMRTPTEFRKDN